MRYKQLATVGVALTIMAVLAGCGTQSPSQSNSNANQLPTSTSSLPKSSPSHFMPANITFVNSNTGYLSGNIVNGNSSIGCVYKTTDGGHTWRKFLDKGSAVSNVAVLGHDVWVHVTDQQNGGLYFSKDEGQSFDRISSMSLSGIDFTSRNVGWAVSQNESNMKTMIMKTTDGGKQWAQVHLPNLESGGGASVSFANQEDGWLLEASQPGAGNQGKALLRTANGGRTWSVISNVQLGEPSKDKQLGSGGYADGIEVVPSHPSNAYVWESRGPLLCTSDGGDSWHGSSATKPEVVEARGVSMQNAKDGFVLLQNMEHRDFILEHTTNGGDSWQVVHKWSYS